MLPFLFRVILLYQKIKLKYKLLSAEELIINLDRLSRFKLPDLSFPRVFHSVILKCLIFPKYSKQDILNLSAKDVSDIFRIIWNESVKNNFKKFTNNKSVNQAFKISLNNSFKNITDYTKTLINTDIIISPILEYAGFDSSPLNLRYLMEVNRKIKNKPIDKEILCKLRTKYALKFPVEKLIIVEGITEEILLPVFADKLHHNQDKEGIYILGAGGKSKSPALYLELKNKLKIPIVLLFDSDAQEIYRVLSKNLAKKDSAIIIKEGEFEDILSLNLIKRSLNNEYKPATPILKKELQIYPKMCQNIENFYKSRHLGEFKKSKLSKIIAENIKYKTDLTLPVKDLIEKLCHKLV